MTAERMVSAGIAGVLALCAVAAMGVGVPVVVDYVSDPDGFLANVAAIFGGFLVAVGVVAGITAWGVLRDARWAFEAAVVATGLLLLIGLGGVTDARASGSLPVAELAVAVGGVALAVLLLVRWALRRDGGRPAD